jgi:hypothetical protein
VELRAVVLIGALLLFAVAGLLLLIAQGLRDK